jgi:hypothetical protein
VRSLAERPDAGASDLVPVVAEALRHASAGPCPDAEDLLSFCEETDLEPAARAGIDAHLTGCRECAITHDRMRQAIERQGPPPVTTQGPVGLLERLRSLVRFEMPPRLALVTRRTTGKGRAPTYERAMEDYARGRYAEALDRLLAARAAGERATSLDFHLGLCLLKAGRAEEAVLALAAAVKSSPGLGEYRWYHAQAQLLAGRGREALTELRRVARLAGPFREPAKALIGTLRGLLEARE